MSLSRPCIDNSFNEEFCFYLEHHLTRTLAKSSNKKIKWLWCDGIKMPIESQLLKQRIVEIKQIETKAWLGIDGQDIYKMTIKFGPCSVANFIAEIPINECIPSEESLEWIKLSIEDKEIELKLN